MGLHKLLASIEKRPLMYLKDYNIDILSAYLQGYYMGRYESNNLDKEDEYFQSFYNWLQKYYDVSNSSAKWSSILLYYNASHKTAIEKFFELYKEWYKEEFGEDAW